MFSQKTAKFNIIICIIFSTVTSSYCLQLQEEEISRWTGELGNELWSLGKTITKFSEIKRTYAFLNAQVEKKDPEKLLQEIVGDMARMVDRKTDAVTCIAQKAEEIAEDFEYSPNATVPMYKYYSSKYSTVEGEPPPKMKKEVKKNKNMYKPMKLNPDTHFYNLSVDTTHSSVHVPTNIYDRMNYSAFAIKWSKKLDGVFTQNYKSDPALSWQYFGSSSGVMRHYPAKRWNLPVGEREDLFDCRIRTWYIEAATCTKDVVILLDNSGSMDGMGKHIAYLTVLSILDTFSNNDYINVMNYSDSINYTVPCFKEMLVQATEENIKVFGRAIHLLKPMGKTKLDQALETAFDLLSKVRYERGCNGTGGKTCNQAIMVVTDGVSKNFSETVLKYNREDGDRIPVRIFTYLIGEEVTNVDEIMWMACANRGYYTHVQTLEQVTSSVLKYINVIARPLVLQGKERPVSWTHAYLDYTYDEEAQNPFSDEPYRLMTSAAVPAFDTRLNKNNQTRVANLLGVAGTDVPIADFETLTFPYKVGVNAYAFIVSNNGYVLMHPDLRPIFNGRPTDNYNSIDLTEVEQLVNDLSPRELDKVLIDLRFALANGSVGSILNVSVKYHYDNMRRVTKEQYDYYFAPIKNTPFSVGIAFPHRYGLYSLHVGDEITKNRHTGAKLTDFFRGDNWKVHPQWVYCRYHYLEGHEYATPEKELRDFLGKMYDSDFTWKKQYEAETDENEDTVKCFREPHEGNDYYCDRQLVQRLVFDAKNTLSAFQGPWTYQSGEHPLFIRYNATLRFVATMSGLTRWEYINQEMDNLNKSEFGDYHSKAIDEIWYKSAVIQRQYDPESFVYSVPFDKQQQEGLVVTASYAIFPSDAGYEAPGSVVGFQFVHANLKARIKELTTKVSNQCPECGTCNTTLECYVIDSSGYIIVSDNDNNTGKFFGEIEGDVMDSMLNESIFEKIVVYDFQGSCNPADDIEEASDATALLTPVDYVRLAIDWFALRIAWLAVDMNLLWTTTYAQDENLDDFIVEDDLEEKNTTEGIDSSSSDDDGDSDSDDQNDEEPEIDYYECDKQRDLFILQQQLFLHDNFPVEIAASRHYYIKKIPFSNLLFVAVNTTMPLVNNIIYTTVLKKIKYEDDVEYPCQKLELNTLPRGSLRGCFNEDPLEREITECGRSSSIKISYIAILLNVLLLYR